MYSYCKIPSRIILSSALIFFAGALALSGPIGCSSVNKVNYDAAVNPNDEAARLDQDISQGYTQSYDVLDSSDFTDAQKQLAKAKKEMASGSKPETVLSTLGESRAYLNRAKERSESLQERSKGILEARSAALDAGVRKFPEANSDFKKQDDDMRSEIDRLASGRTSTQRWADLQRGYLALETRAIQNTRLGEINSRVYNAVQNGAKKNTPNLLAAVERDVQNAKNIIASNRRDNSAIDPAVEKANKSSQLLVEVLAATKRPEGVINEDAARVLVLQGRKLHAMNEKLGDVNSEVAAQSEQLSDQQKELKNAALTMNLNKALESARKEFTSSEADVYRQGDKLLIRLKAVNFPVGRADLPTQSLALLAKVKSIAEELNPAQITVEGHTDSTGKAQTNKVLSQDRAEAVAQYLSNNGVEKDKINTIGYGYEKPLGSNKSKVGRAQNRRVDVIITPGAPTAADAGTSSM